MQISAQSQKPWLSKDFAQRFREAFGRDMTETEQKFFGIDAEVTKEQQNPTLNGDRRNGAD